MYNPSTTTYQQHRGFARTFNAGRLSLGLFFPIEAFQGDTPMMSNQIELARRAEVFGFSALWFRDVPLRDPSFGDVGQVFDPWVYLGFIAAQTSTIALGTASIAIPLRNPPAHGQGCSERGPVEWRQVPDGRRLGRPSRRVSGIRRRPGSAGRHFSGIPGGHPQGPAHQLRAAAMESWPVSECGPDSKAHYERDSVFRNG